MLLKTQNAIILMTGIGFFIADQFLKFQSLHSWQQPQLVMRFFGWEPFLNPGIAFSIPIPYWLTLILSAPIILLLIYFLVRHLNSPVDNLRANNILITLALTLVLAGALSNSFDRLFRHQTVDYIRILTGIINLADVFIVSGFICYVIQKKLMKNK